MTSYRFNNFNDLIHFLFEAKETNNNFNNVFDEWEVTYVFLNTPQGLELRLNTKTIDTSGVHEYMLWKKVKNLIKTYLTQDIPQEFSNSNWYDRIPYQFSELDIRFRAPESLKQSIDIYSQFDSFRLNFLIHSGLIIAHATSIERDFPVEAETIKKWNGYVSSIINKWIIDNNKQ